MRKIKLPKLDKTEVQVLQLSIVEFAQHLGNNLKNSDLNSFLDAMIAMDISSNLFYLLRNKIEKETTIITLNLSVSHAATIAKCCHCEFLTTDDYSRNLMLKLSHSIDQQLKSL